MEKSIVYLVGAGPGDSKLITVRGWELLKKADCIIYDYLVNRDLLKVVKNGCKLIYVGKKAGQHTLTQEQINQLLAGQAKMYHTVVRLKGGDPFVFGRGAEEAVYLRTKGINVEIVPGVTSAIAAPAYAGIPLTERSKNSTVGFITGHEDPTKIDSRIDWPALVKGLGTMVFLMGLGNLKLIVQRLIQNGKPGTTPVALIRWGTTARQQTVVGKLANIVQLAQENKLTPPVIIVVGETVKLRKELNWFETKPLFGKKIVVTRAREQASRLSEKLAELGAQVFEIPTIKIVSLKADQQLNKAFLSSKFDWVFFTSQNGVQEFASFLERTGQDSRIFGQSKICAIGSETARSCLGIGIRPDYVPAQFVAEAVVKHFRNKKGCALILRAKKARDLLPEGLTTAGFRVTTINLYDTQIPQESSTLLKQVLKEKIDYVTFTSSSTVENFIQLLGEEYKRKLYEVKIASIGPITSATIKRSGLPVLAQAKVYTIAGLVRALVKAS